MCRAGQDGEGSAAEMVAETGNGSASGRAQRPYKSCRAQRRDRGIYELHCQNLSCVSQFDDCGVEVLIGSISSQADVYDHMDFVLTSLDMFAGISENLINYGFNVRSC